MPVDMTGFVYDVKGNPIAGATAGDMTAQDTNHTGTSPADTDTTDANGRWDFPNIANGDYDVRITVGVSVYWIKHANTIQHQSANFSTLYIDDNTNAMMAAGITINQGDADNELLALKSSDVGHGATGVAEADTFGTFEKEIAATGGLRLRGYTEADIGIRIQGISTTNTTEMTDKDDSATGVIILDARRISSTGIGGTYSTNSNIVVIQAVGVTKFIFDLEGQMHATVTSTTFDAEDDIALVHDIEAHMLPDKFEPERYTREDLEELGLIGKGSWHEENGKVHAMVNFTRLAMLQQGALQQLHGRIKVLERKSLVGRIRTWLGRAA